MIFQRIRGAARGIPIGGRVADRELSLPGRERVNRLWIMLKCVTTTRARDTCYGSQGSGNLDRLIARVSAATMPLASPSSSSA
jgi:hypothetical protein